MKNKEDIFSKTSSYQVSTYEKIKRNLEYARNWYKKNKPDKKIKFSVEDSGSSHGGNVKKAILIMSYIPEVGEKLSNLSIPICTYEDELDFRGEINKAYEIFQKHLKKRQELLEKGKLFSVPQVPKKGSKSLFKTLSHLKQYDHKGGK